MEAVEVLREMNWDGLRKVPQNASLSFIRRRWEAYVLGPEGVDRRFYELCIMSELKNSLRSGDVSVSGSRQFRDFEDYLMPRHDFDRTLAQGELGVAVPTTGAAYIQKSFLLPFGPVAQSANRLESRLAAGKGPQFLSCGSIERKYFLRQSEAVKYPAYDQGISLQSTLIPGLEGPRDPKSTYILSVDLSQRRVATPHGIAAVDRPVLLLSVRSSGPLTYSSTKSACNK